MKKIIILKGIPASGKSTYAKKLIADSPGMYKRINRDSLRAMLDNGHFSKGNEKFIKKTRDFLIKEALIHGKHVIVDDTNLDKSNLERIQQIAADYRAETGHQVKVEEKIMEIDVDEAILRDSKRENPVGREVILKMHKKLHGEKRLKNEIREQDVSLPKAIICDLDGTLSLINNRSPFEGNKCEQDLPNIPVMNLVKNYKNLGFKILLLSGRSSEHQPETERWLNKYEVEYDALWMRKAKDNRKDAIIKEELFTENIEKNYYIEFVLDDRNQVVDLWRQKLQLPCLQVFYGNF
ncbi:AAA family ATPase [Kordia algicida OT-1]|uniref:Putative phage polynucleotide kinase n=1 Tax=Kordia algicida OT-1 TaxID=391587 RepID=A9DK79_9FLAO|nr:AAA family ATPase [Kordia algicida]EDP98272.1 putative phage polynucleotide kinase [Kordia algicida OT-1]